MIVSVVIIVVDVVNIIIEQQGLDVAATIFKGMGYAM
jgi:hypothetical protein